MQKNVCFIPVSEDILRGRVPPPAKKHAKALLFPKKSLTFTSEGFEKVGFFKIKKPNYLIIK